MTKAKKSGKIKIHTQAEVDRLLPQPKVFRKNANGFLYLTVQPSGTKTWSVSYYLLGHQRSMTLGNADTLSLLDANERGWKVLKTAAQGINPNPNVKMEEKELKAAKERDKTIQYAVDLYYSQTANTGEISRELDVSPPMLRSAALQALIAEDEELCYRLGYDTDFSLAGSKESGKLFNRWAKSNPPKEETVEQETKAVKVEEKSIDSLEEALAEIARLTQVNATLTDENERLSKRIEKLKKPSWFKRIFGGKREVALEV